MEVSEIMGVPQESLRIIQVIWQGLSTETHGDLGYFPWLRKPPYPTGGSAPYLYEVNYIPKLAEKMGQPHISVCVPHIQATFGI